MKKLIAILCLCLCLNAATAEGQDVPESAPVVEPAPVAVEPAPVDEAPVVEQQQDAAEAADDTVAEDNTDAVADANEDEGDAVDTGDTVDTGDDAAQVEEAKGEAEPGEAGDNTAETASEDTEGGEDAPEQQQGNDVPANAEAWYATEDGKVFGTPVEIVAKLEGAGPVYLRKSPLTLADAPLRKLSGITFGYDSDVFTDGNMWSASLWTAWQSTLRTCRKRTPT